MNEADLYVETFGAGTEYEAVFVMAQTDDGFIGHLRFTNKLYSPLAYDGLNYFAYITPSAASGALCRARALNEWEWYGKIFDNVRRSKSEIVTDGLREIRKLASSTSQTTNVKDILDIVEDLLKE